MGRWWCLVFPALFAVLLQRSHSFITSSRATCRSRNGGASRVGGFLRIQHSTTHPGRRSSINLAVRSSFDINRNAKLTVLRSTEITSNTDITQDNDDDADDFEIFLDQKALRKAILNCPTFANMPPVDIERVVQSCTKVHTKEGDYVFKKGDPAKDLYFVRSGAYEIILPNDGWDGTTNLDIEDGNNYEAIRVEEGAAFGELGLLFGQPRAATVRAACSPSSLWKLDQESFQVLMKEQNRKASAISDIERQGMYTDFFRTLKLKKDVKKCQIFKTMTDADLQRIVESMTQLRVEKGDTVTIQGSLNDEDMFFVESGSFDFINEKTNQTAGGAKEGDYFGELALLFNEPRALTSRAREASTVWVLNGDVFLGAVQESPLLPQLLQYLRDRYRDGVGWRFLRFLRELMDVLKVASRPKNKKVSFHSFLATIASGMLLCTYIPMLSPGFENGWPRLFNVAAPAYPGVILMQQVSTVLLAAVSLTGAFRFARSTSKTRIRLFTVLSLTNFAATVMSLSNLSGFANNYMVDAWSWPGRLLILVAASAALGNSFSLAYDMTKGPAEDDWMSNTLFENTPKVLWSFSWFTCLILLNLYPAVVMFRSKEWFYKVAVPLYRATGFDYFTMLARFQSIVYVSMGALIATFQHERRMRPRKAAAWLSAIFVLSFFDIARYQFASLGLWGGSLPNMETYATLYATVFKPILKQYHLIKAHIFFMTLPHILGGFAALKRIWGEKKEKQKGR